MSQHSVMSTERSGGSVRRTGQQRAAMEAGASQGLLVGIGIMLDSRRVHGELPMISAVEQKGGAHASGNVYVGDLLETVNGARVRYLETEEIARSLLGPHASHVQLGLIRYTPGGEETQIHVTAERMPIVHQKKGQSNPDSSFGGLDPGINLSTVLANMRAGVTMPRTFASGPDSERFLGDDSSVTSYARVAPRSGSTSPRRQSQRALSQQRSQGGVSPGKIPRTPRSNACSIKPRGPNSFVDYGNYSMANSVAFYREKITHASKSRKGL